MSFRALLHTGVLSLFLCLLPTYKAAIPLSQDGSPAATEPSFTFRATTREVIVVVIAVDSRNRPVLDLTPTDLQVFEQVGRSRIPKTISSFRFFDPDSPESAQRKSNNGFHAVRNISCLERTSAHYELAYHPGSEGWTSGYHQVLITSRRRGLKLFFRHSYYVGETSPPEKPQRKDAQQLAKELWQAACDHPVAPPSISLRAVLIATGRRDLLRYSVNIDSDSLAFVSLSENGRQLQLDYGACNFDSTGHPINYMTAATDQVLTSLEYARAQEHGFHRLFEYAVPKDLAMTRFVVRDRATGNLGSVDVLFPWSDGTPHANPTLESALHERERLAAEKTLGSGNLPPGGPIGSYGSVVPNPLSMCADVYDLPTGTAQLPDFRTLDPVGSVYADSLDVPNQLSSPTCGVPGATCKTEYFGLDYHGTFWVSVPGKYEFELTSDDGARLQIDDTRVVDNDGTHGALSARGRISLDAGRHTIHVPYFEGFPVAVALELWVKPPDKEWRLFNVRDFPPSPSEPVAQAHSTTN